MKYNTDLSIIVRKYKVIGHDLKPNQQMKLISILEKRGIVAIKDVEFDRVSKERIFYVLVECKDRMPSSPITIDGWNFTFQQVDGTIKLDLKNPNHRKWIEEFYLRNCQATINRSTDLWVYKGNSRRQFYEPNPFDSSDEIEGFRRFDLSSKYIDTAGLAINVEVKTAYFTKYPVEYYFLNGHEDRFAELTMRFQDLEYVKYKGTLLFKGPNFFTKCYFVKFCKGLTLSTTPPISIDGKNYDNVFDYYKQEYPQYNVSENDTVALVSFAFDGGGGEKYVPAKKLFLRVMNSAIEGDLSHEDKISPEERIRLIHSFWKRLGDKPFGNNLVGVCDGLYSPNENWGQIMLPGLLFGNRVVKAPPSNKQASEYKSHYRQVLDYLKKYGCYFVPKVIDRKLHFVFPGSVFENAKTQFVNDLISVLNHITKCEIEPIVNGNDNYISACQELLNNESTGIVAFTFEDNDPSTYYNISYELENWKIQHITSRELLRKYRQLERDRNNRPIGDPRKSKGEKNWDSFIHLIAFGIIQELGCIPYVFQPCLNYQMHIKIDVSEKFQFFGIGMMIYNNDMPYPVIDPIIKPKLKRNDIVESPKLEKYFRELLLRNSALIKKHNICKALALKDGQEFGTEYEALLKVVSEMKGKELPENFTLDFIEYHKDTANEIRIWDRASQNRAENVLEGTYVKLDSRTALLATTGAGTLSQGTAQPIYLHSKYADLNMDEIAFDVFMTSQLNFNSPSVAQRLTLLAKRIDDLLREKKAQSVEQLK